MVTVRVRNKNVLWELLNAGLRFEKITLVNNLKEDNLTTRILSLAKDQNVPIERVPISRMDYGRSGQRREMIVGFLTPEKERTLENLLASLYQNNQTPFFLLLNRVNYASNLGVIIRTAFAAGVNGLIYQGDKNQIFNDETFHISMGTVARISLIKMSIFEALKDLKKNGIKTFSVQMDGTSYFKEDLSGAVAFVLGGEGEGISETISSRCDKKLSIPMQAGIDSLNVSSSAAVVLYEKVRQESSN